MGMCVSVFLFSLLSQPVDAFSPESLLAEVKHSLPHRKHLLAAKRPEITDAQYLAALGGKPISGIALHEGMDAGQGWGVTVFKEPVERVWAALTNEEVLDGKMSLDVSAVLEGPEYGHGRLIFQSLDLPRPLTDRYWLTRISHGAAAYRASKGALWELSWVDENKTKSLAGTPYAKYEEKATPLDWTQGAWLLVPLSNGNTLVEYFIWSDPGGFIPPALASKFAPGQVLSTLESMESVVVEQLGKPLPAGVVRPDGSEY
jgi:hypothetical protein